MLLLHQLVASFSAIYKLASECNFTVIVERLITGAHLYKPILKL